MNKKNVATTIVLLLCACLFTIIGSSFINFMYAKNKIEVNDPKVTIASGVQVWDSKDDDKTQIETLKFSKSSLGLKPVTGESDAETNIPSTVTNKHGTEGLYSSIKVTAPAGLKIVVTNIQIESEQDAEEVSAERKNIWIALKDEKNSANNFEEDTLILLSNDDAIEEKEYVVLFWLDGKAGEDLKGAKISFEMQFIV